MWFEILPPLGIMVVAMNVPWIATNLMHRFFLDTPCKREVLDVWDLNTYQRDMTMTGSAYKINGLEQIPDEDSK